MQPAASSTRAQDVTSDPRSRARIVVRRLARAYGPAHPSRPQPQRRDPLDELILTVLSQNTSDLNRDRAWVSLRGRYPTWEAVERARVDALERAIAPGGLARSKAPRLRAILREVRAREGSLSLERLAAMSDDEVVEYLTTLPGIGPKTAACVLAFSLGRLRLPVDTHVARIATRLGFAPPGASISETQRALEALVPPKRRVGVHLDLIAHGRTVCRAPRPSCSTCVLADVCPAAGTLR